MSIWDAFKGKVAAATAVCLVTLGAIAPAHAIFGIGDIVFDPSNYAENALSAARALPQIENQLKQLENEALNLTGLDFNSIDRLRNVLSTTKRLVDDAQGMAFQLDRVRDEFRRLYPEAYGEGASFEQMLIDALERWNYSREALDTAM